MSSENVISYIMERM